MEQLRDVSRIPVPVYTGAQLPTVISLSLCLSCSISELVGREGEYTITGKKAGAKFWPFILPDLPVFSMLEILL